MTKGGTAPPTILAVDDQVAIVELLEDMLQDEGYAVVSCGDGVQALAMLSTVHPDLVVSDVQMPKLDGWQFVQQVRVQPQWSKLPVILMSAASKLPFEPKSLDAMTAFITKPFNFSEMLELVARMLEQAHT
jgi:CheY-like chemotaxis protein